MKGVLLLVSLVTISLGGRITTQGEPYFACSSKYLFAFGEKGDLKWKTPVESRGGFEQITEDMIVLRSPLKERMGLEYAAYDPAKGSLIWKTAIPYHDSIYVGYNETLYVIKSDLGNYLLNLKSGEVKFEEAPEGWESHGYMKIGGKKQETTKKYLQIWSPPEAPEEIVVSPSSGFIFGFDPEGNVEWKIRRPKEFSGYCCHNNTCALKAGKDLIVLNILTGKIKWQQQVQASIRGCGTREEELTVYLSNDEKLTFDIETGELLEK